MARQPTPPPPRLKSIMNGFVMPCFAGVEQIADSDIDVLMRIDDIEHKTMHNMIMKVKKIRFNLLFSLCFKPYFTPHRLKFLTFPGYDFYRFSFVHYIIGALYHYTRLQIYRFRPI